MEASFLRAAQVIESSDVLFLFGNVQGVKDSIAANQDSLQEHHILVPVTRDGRIEEYQVHIATYPARHELESNFIIIIVSTIIFIVIISIVTMMMIIIIHVIALARNQDVNSHIITWLSC